MNEATLAQLVSELNRQLGNQTLFEARVTAITNGAYLVLAVCIAFPLIFIPVFLWTRAHIKDDEDRFGFTAFAGLIALIPLVLALFGVVTSVSILVNPRLYVYQQILTQIMKAVAG